MQIRPRTISPGGSGTIRISASMAVVYIESARAIGAPTYVILIKHVLPNCFSPILVQATLRVGSSIISAAGLSYIGLGVLLRLRPIRFLLLYYLHRRLSCRIYRFFL